MTTAYRDSGEIWGYIDFKKITPKPQKTRRQKNIERVAQEAERRQRFSKGRQWK